MVDAEAGEIGREGGRWICELSPPPPLPPPGAVHSCDDLFVEAERAFLGTGTPIISSAAFHGAGFFGLGPPFRSICCWPPWWWWLW